jgi:hypothetical protein
LTAAAYSSLARLRVNVGLLAGLAGTAAPSQTLRRVFLGLSNLNPRTYVKAIGVLLAIAAVVAMLLVRRAFQVDPMRALHYDQSTSRVPTELLAVKCPRTFDRNYETFRGTVTLPNRPVTLSCTTNLTT